MKPRRSGRPQIRCYLAVLSCLYCTVHMLSSINQSMDQSIHLGLTDMIMEPPGSFVDLSKFGTHAGVKHHYLFQFPPAPVRCGPVGLFDFHVKSTYCT